MIVSRFAPAPTGCLHLGHLLNALHVWGIVRAVGGRVLLRIEDHDRMRCRDVYERAILDDLDWLGFVPDEPSTADFRSGPCAGRQRDRQAVYQSALESLAAAGLIYACDCTRRNLREAMHATSVNTVGGEVRYSGRCAHRGLAWRDGRGLRVRFASPGDASRDVVAVNRRLAAVERFDDLRHGPIEQCPAEQCGDMLVKDRDGNWTYQFAVTVDDLEQGVNLVIRGDDLLPSTGRQIQLARLLGRAVPPRFLHHPLIMKSHTQKLSKADRDTSIQDLRAAGHSVEAVIGAAVFAGGLCDAPVPMSRDVAEARMAERYAAVVDRLSGSE